MTEHYWFDYRIHVHPHHTDYAGIVWHGTYIAWMEEARIEHLRSHQVSFADWVAAGVDLPVVDVSLKYRQSFQMGMEVLVRTRPEPSKGVRLVWQYDIQNAATQETYVLGTVTLVPVDRQSRRVLRRLPTDVEGLLRKMGVRD